MQRAILALGVGMVLAGCASQPSGPVEGALPKGARAMGDPVLESPTLRSLGVYWIIQGDRDKDAKVTLEYRVVGKTSDAAAHHMPGSPWVRGADLFRVEKGANDMGAPSKREEHTSLPVPADAWLFAGSALMLQPDTQYEIKLTLVDRDGGQAEKILGGPKAHTIAEPVQPKDMQTFHVIPGNGGGTGSQADPFKGLAAADAAAKPGSLFLVHAGYYVPVKLTHSGEPGKPIIYRGVTKVSVDVTREGQATEPIIDGKADKDTPRAIDIANLHDIWLERLAIQNAHNGVVMADSQRIVIRRCRITGITYGINGASNKSKSNEAFFISDNTILGPSTWPRTKGIEEARGMQMAGRGHDVCYNFVKGFGDGIDTYQGPVCEAIDFHNNEIQLCTDDGSEMDYSERNTRNFENRYTNVFQGISLQPIFGGPVYVFRNSLYNIEAEPLKIHNSPSGVLIFNNTFVKNGTPAVVMTPAEMHNFLSRNNLFVGAPGKYACQMDLGKIVDSDWDYDGFAGAPWAMFLRWGAGHDYSLKEVRQSGPAEKNAVIIEYPQRLFASGAVVPADVKVEQPVQDLRLAKGSEAVNQGVMMPGLTGEAAGKKPDLGAYELGQELPQYGPRPE